ncbi:MAG: 30S ribosomal protein S4 [Candidatus Saccharibacteria bacterium]|nr:30S ribosomal protein S4 [Candidatus Saccharibacteria bacterium]MCY4010973.1 30S ribosomal protein S4 [Candidatus Saccharibacteria bacterium]MCY4089070.1 30S ribosomal protein S4 [Candidatus Saccharibacteria bacterium]
MARDLAPVVKQSRRENFALHPKAHKYLIKKSGIPGQHGGSGRRLVNRKQYAIQLREKQKVRRLYGLLEKQFANLFKKSLKQKGQGGSNALSLLERRLDNAVYRAGFASSRQAARQLVSHKHLILNSRRVNIASITLKIGDKIQVRPQSQKNAYFKFLNDLSPAPAQLPNWLKINRDKLTFEVVALPIREDIPEEINEQLVVEYYSR